MVEFNKVVFLQNHTYSQSSGWLNMGVSELLKLLELYLNIFKASLWMQRLYLNGAFLN